MRRKAAFDTAPANQADLLGQVLAPFAGKALAGYVPIRSEIDPISAMTAHDGPVCVPVIQGSGLPLRFRAWAPGCDMVAGPFGAKVPACGDWVVPDVLIVPLVAFDRQGRRLGYGGGFYDRTLQALRDAGPTLAIGFAFAAQETECVPTDSTDQPLDRIVTEREILGEAFRLR